MRSCAIAPLLFLLVFLGSCSSIEVPEDIPGIDLKLAPASPNPGSFQFVNFYKKQDLIAINDSVFSPTYIDRGVWSEYFIQKLSLELQKRGCLIDPDPNRTIEVKFLNMRTEGGFVLSVQAAIELSCGKYRKTYNQIDTSGLWMSRAKRGAMIKLIIDVLKDPDFIAVVCSPEGGGIETTCPHCEAKVDRSKEFCGDCGKPLSEAKCPKCGTENKGGAKFCSECAEKLE